jgi:O-antigen/teichoic acid export membrane protein
LNLNGVKISIAIGISTFLSLILSVVIGRISGPVAFGEYTFVITIANIVTIFLQMGMPILLIREIAKYKQQLDYRYLSLLWDWSTNRVLIATLLFFIILSGAVGVIYKQINPTADPLVLFISLILVVVITQSAIEESKLKGLNLVALSIVPDKIIKPILIILAILIFSLYFSIELKVVDFLTIYTLFSIVAFVLLRGVANNRITPYKKLILRRGVDFKFEEVIEKNIKSSKIFMYIAVAQVINMYSDVVMLGFYVSFEEVGYYRVAVQSTVISTFSSTVIVMLIMPIISSLYVKGDMKKIKEILKKMVLYSVIFSLIVTFSLLLYGKSIISISYGIDYIDAYTPMIILLFSQMISAFFGFLGPVLNMTGHERLVLYGISISMVLNIILNMVLIPLYGMNGAAIGSAVTLTIWNALLWVLLYKKTRIDCSIYSVFR